MTDRYRLSRPVFLAIWLGLVVAFVIVIVTGAPIMLLALIGPWQPRPARVHAATRAEPSATDRQESGIAAPGRTKTPFS
jgi:hypothetical protein